MIEIGRSVQCEVGMNKERWGEVIDRSVWDGKNLYMVEFSGIAMDLSVIENDSATYEEDELYCPPELKEICQTEKEL